jgi:hypothetical protein
VHRRPAVVQADVGVGVEVDVRVADVTIETGWEPRGDRQMSVRRLVEEGVKWVSAGSGEEDDNATKPRDDDETTTEHIQLHSTATPRA